MASAVICLQPILCGQCGTAALWLLPNFNGTSVVQSRVGTSFFQFYLAAALRNVAGGHGNFSRPPANLDRGRDEGLTSPLPPNRTGRFPASGRSEAATS